MANAFLRGLRLILRYNGEWRDCVSGSQTILLGVGPPSFVGFADMDKSLIQTAPYFFRDDRNPAYLANMFAGQSIFLLCGGPVWPARIGRGCGTPS